MVRRSSVIELPPSSSLARVVRGRRDDRAHADVVRVVEENKRSNGGRESKKFTDRLIMRT